MPDEPSQFEIKDNTGSTEHFNSSVTTVVSVPSIADKIISEVYLQNVSTAANRTLQVSFDGGSNFVSIARNSHLAWTPKADLKQLRVKSATASSVDYEFIINFEDY